MFRQYNTTLPKSVSAIDLLPTALKQILELNSVYLFVVKKEVAGSSLVNSTKILKYVFFGEPNFIYRKNLNYIGHCY